MNYSELPMPSLGDVAAVGLSGGVDSCVTAVLLKERGCKVIGVTMSHWNGETNTESARPHRHSCYGPDEAFDIEECRAFCADWDIEYHVIDVRAAYKKEVIDYYTGEYRAGRTPNPCIRCNRSIKFGALLEGLAQKKIAFDYFCTGHYARIVRPDDSVPRIYGEESGGEAPAMLMVPADEKKDQTYFLYRVPSGVLEKTRFPLAGLTKDAVREIAQKKGLSQAARSESQDFAPAEYADSLFEGKFSAAGDFVDLNGKILGRHRGIERYTVGQRRGLGVSAAQPLYVRSICKENNSIVLAQEESLYCAALIADDVVWAGDYAPRVQFAADVKIRLGSKPARAVITPLEQKKIKIAFDAPVRAASPGQSAVLYIDGVVAGGGIISEEL